MEWRKQRSKEEDELRKLKDKQAKRKVWDSKIYNLSTSQNFKILLIDASGTRGEAIGREKRAEDERRMRELEEKKQREQEEKLRRLEEAERKRQLMLQAQKVNQLSKSSASST